MRAPLALLLAAMALPACSRTPADPVDVLLAELRAAAEARDVHRFGERLSPDFRGGPALGRSEAIAQLGRYFAAYDSVGLEVYDVMAERDGTTARVRCVVELKGRARKAFGLDGLLPPSAVYRFDLDVAEEGGTWRVREATWEHFEPGDPGR